MRPLVPLKIAHQSQKQAAVGQFHFSFEQITHYLSLLASFINHIGFLLPSDTINRYHYYQNQYQYFYNFYTHNIQDEKKELITFPSEIKSCNTLLEELKNYTLDLLEKIANALDTPSLIEKLKAVRNVLETYSSNNSKFKERLKESYESFFSEQQNLEKAFEKNFELSHIDRNGIITKRLGTHFPMAVRQQEIIYRLRNQLDHFDISTPLKEKSLPTIPFIKSAYRELGIITWLVKPNYVISSLKRKEEQLANKLSKCTKQKDELQARLGDLFPIILRLFRIIDAYQKWNDYLQKQNLSKLASSAEQFSTTLTNQQLVTYQKKKIFKNIFVQKNTIFLMNALYDYVQTPNHAQLDKKAIYRNLLTLRKTLRNDSQIKEQALFKKTSRISRLSAMSLLLLTQHPIYQLGVTVSHTVSKRTESSSLFIFKERLPENLQNQLEIACGITYLGMSLVLSNAIGYVYSWYIIAIINQVLWTQYDVLVKIGCYLDETLQGYYLPGVSFLKYYAPRSLNPAFFWFEELIRYDEIGLHRKEKLISHLFCLSLQLIISGGQDCLPTTIAYVCASVCSEFATLIADKVEKSGFLSVTTCNSLKVIINIVLYSVAYQYAFQFVQERTKLFSSSFSQTKALKLFGFSSVDQTNKNEIQARYRELALKNHPDKCGTSCELSMTDINEAHEVLTRPMN